MDPEAIQQGLAAAVAGISFDSNGTTVKLQSLPAIADKIDPPTFAPSDLEFTYDRTFGGLVEALYTCGLFVSRGDTDAGRLALVNYLRPGGPASLKAAIEADRTLGGACAQLIVERVRGAYRLYTIGGTDYLGAMIDVRVWAQ